MSNNIVKYIIFENKYFIILNKPVNLVVHSGTNNQSGLIDKVKKCLRYKKFNLKLGHRLDKDTTGCLLISKNNFFLVKFQKLLAFKKVTKIYYAIVYGITEKKFKIITDQKSIHRYNKKIKNLDTKVITECRRVCYYNNYSLIRIKLLTGKIHQIRIHLAYIGHPIICDNKYGNITLNKVLLELGFKYIFLHASSIAFICPITMKKIFVKTKITYDFIKLITLLKNGNLLNAG